MNQSELPTPESQSSVSKERCEFDQKVYQMKIAMKQYLDTEQSKYGLEKLGELITFFGEGIVEGFALFGDEPVFEERVQHDFNQADRNSYKESFFELAALLNKYNPDRIIMLDTSSRPLSWAVKTLASKYAGNCKSVNFLATFRDEDNPFLDLTRVDFVHTNYAKDRPYEDFKEEEIKEYIDGLLKFIEEIENLTKIDLLDIISLTKKSNPTLSDFLEKLASSNLIANYGYKLDPKFEKESSYYGEVTLEKFIKDALDNLDPALSFGYVLSEADLTINLISESEYGQRATPIVNQYFGLQSKSENTLMKAIKNAYPELSDREVKIKSKYIETEINKLKHTARSDGEREIFKRQGELKVKLKDYIDLVNTLKYFIASYPFVINLTPSEFFTYLRELRNSLTSNDARRKAVEMVDEVRENIATRIKNIVQDNEKVLVVDEIFSEGSSFHEVDQYFKRAGLNNVNIEYFTFSGSDTTRNFFVEGGDKKTVQVGHENLIMPWKHNKKVEITGVTKPKFIHENITGISKRESYNSGEGLALRRLFRDIVAEVISEIE